ncbi:MAG TPA: protein kinase, partial [Candidatus Xenobia bacterium]
MIEWTMAATVAVAAIGLWLWRRQASPPVKPATKDSKQSDVGIGTIIGGYRLEGVVKFGHTWHVYRARGTTPDSHQDVVVKLLSPKLMDEGVDMLAWEATLSACRDLRHPGILGVLSSGEKYGRYYLVQRYSTAVPLRDLWRENPLSVTRIYRVMADLFDIVTTLHAHHLLHGRISIDRVRLGQDGRLELWDLGVRRNPEHSAIG